MLTKHYRGLIATNPEWELAGIYADVGSVTRNRPEFARLLADCEAGRVDLIVTKSIARFSRDSVEVMRTVRTLRSMKRPVDVYFESENLTTSKIEHLILLSVIGTIAMAESAHKHDRLSMDLRKYSKPERNAPEKRNPVDEPPLEP